MELNELKKFSSELLNMLVQGALALDTIQGLELGFFDSIPETKPVTPQELSHQLGYEISKVERWLRFASANGFLTHSDGGYRLTSKGSLLRKNTPVPDLLGLHHLFSYFTLAVQHSRESYQTGVGLDSISRGKISRDYIPRVASQLSNASAEFFKWSGLSSGHTILDLGCGDGSVLRQTAKSCPGISATGLDLNSHTLELARKKNSDAGLQDQIDVQIGDVTDLSGFRDNAFDWVYAINVFHFLPLVKRETFLQEMIRISRYGVFFNQIILNAVQTVAVDVLLSTLFTDYTGFFTVEEADEIIKKTGITHYYFSSIIQNETRVVVMYTSKSNAPLNRLAGLSEADRGKLASVNVNSAKDLLIADPAKLVALGLDVSALRAASIKLLFP